MSIIHSPSNHRPGHPWPGAQQEGLPFKAVPLIPLRPFVGIKLIDLRVNAAGLA